MKVQAYSKGFSYTYIHAFLDSLPIEVITEQGVEFPVLHSSVQFTSVAQLCLTLCDPMDCSTPGLLVHHQLPELTQTHVCRVSDAIQSSHPLWSWSSPILCYTAGPPSLSVVYVVLCICQSLSPSLFFTPPSLTW